MLILVTVNVSVWFRSKLWWIFVFLSWYFGYLCFEKRGLAFCLSQLLPTHHLPTFLLRRTRSVFFFPSTSLFFFPCSLHVSTTIPALLRKANVTLPRYLASTDTAHHVWLLALLCGSFLRYRMCWGFIGSTSDLENWKPTILAYSGQTEHASQDVH